MVHTIQAIASIVMVLSFIVFSLCYIACDVRFPLKLLAARLLNFLGGAKLLYKQSEIILFGSFMLWSIIAAWREQEIGLVKVIGVTAAIFLTREFYELLLIQIDKIFSYPTDTSAQKIHLRNFIALLTLLLLILIWSLA